MVRPSQDGIEAEALSTECDPHWHTNWHTTPRKRFPIGALEVAGKW
jgi:hypothetical protein